MLVLPLSNKKFITIMSVMCKFSKQVIFVKGADILSAEQWAYAFFNWLDQMN